MSALRWVSGLASVWALTGWGMEVRIAPTFGGESLRLEQVVHTNASGEKFSVTRCSFLLSDFRVLTANGTWIQVDKPAAWFDTAKPRRSTRLDVPPGAYSRLRFDVGLPNDLNHADPCRLAAEDDLNPNLNGLHWNWQGGYVFLALEGLWDRTGTLEGWAYHLAKETNRVTVEIMFPAAFAESSVLELELDLNRLLDGPRPLSLEKDGATTHSRDGDPIATALASNLRSGFRVVGVSDQSAKREPITSVQPISLPAKFTPWRFVLNSTFPIPALPKDNPLITERVELGRILFHDENLSRDRSLSCASCHQSAAGFADPRKTSRGVEDRPGTRNSMPLQNLAWKEEFFWDGRAPSLRAQVLIPIQDHNEMDLSLTNLVTRLAEDADYATLFGSAFAAPEVTSEKVALALEQFLLTLTSFNSRFDRTLRGEDQLSGQEKRGFELFMTEYDPRTRQYGADCFHCHGGALFTTHQFANNGLDTKESAKDPGRKKVTGKEADRSRFAIPSLRNIALTAPYMHDGRFDTLEEVIDHYDHGLKRSDTLDPNLAKHPTTGLGLSAEDKAALAAFLRTLTDEQFQGKGRNY